MRNYKASFLWPHEDGSIEEAGYEFANAQTVEYQIHWWEILQERIANQTRSELLKPPSPSDLTDWSGEGVA